MNSQARSLVPVVLACLLLGACSSLSSVFTSSKTVPPSTTHPNTTPETSTQPRARSSETGEKMTPEILPGLSVDEATNLFGRPNKVMEKTTAQVWEYRDGSCRLSLAFYPEVGTQIYHVLTYELENGGRDLDACLVQLRGNHVSRRR